MNNEELKQLRKFYQDVEQSFLAPGMTPFKICRAVWRLVGQMSSWYAEHPPNNGLHATGESRLFTQGD